MSTPMSWLRWKLSIVRCWMRGHQWGSLIHITEVVELRVRTCTHCGLSEVWSQAPATPTTGEQPE